MSILKSLLQETSEYTLGGQVALEGLSCGNEVLEISDEYNEIISMEDAIERLGEIHDSLEELLVISEDSLEEGGLDANTSQVLRISTEALVSPLGLDSPILSPESFGSDGERLSSTRVSIEEEKSTIQKVWDAILRSLQALRQKISEWFNNVWKNADKMLEKLKALNKTIDESGEPKSSAKISYALSTLIMDGQNEKSIKSNMSNMNSALTAFTGSSGSVKVATDALKHVSGVDAKKLTKEDVATLKSVLADDFKKYSNLFPTKSGNVPKSMEVPGGTVSKSATLPGNKALYSVTSGDIKKVTWKVGADTEGKDLKEKKDITVEGPSDLKGYVDSAIAVVETVVAYKKEKENIKKFTKELTDAGKKLSSESKGTDGEKFGKIALGYLSGIEKMVHTPTNSLTALGIKSAGAVSGFVTACLKEYEKK